MPSAGSSTILDHLHEDREEQEDEDSIDTSWEDLFNQDDIYYWCLAEPLPDKPEYSGSSPA